MIRQITFPDYARKYVLKNGFLADNKIDPLDFYIHAVHELKKNGIGLNWAKNEPNNLPDSLDHKIIEQELLCGAKGRKLHLKISNFDVNLPFKGEELDLWEFAVLASVGRHIIVTSNDVNKISEGIVLSNAIIAMGVQFMATKNSLAQPVGRFCKLEGLTALSDCNKIAQNAVLQKDINEMWIQLKKEQLIAKKNWPKKLTEN